MTSVQPDNRSALQQAIEETLDRRLGAIEQAAPLPGALNAKLTPIQLLPSLSIERGVSDWDADDSEQSQRDTISNAIPLIGLSGTGAGISWAISALGFLSDVTRVRPYVLLLVVHLSDQELTEQLTSRLARRAKAYKAARDAIEISLSRSVQGVISAPCTLQFGNILTIHPYVPEEVTVTGQTFVASAVHSIQTLTISPGGA